MNDRSFNAETDAYIPSLWTQVADVCRYYRSRIVPQLIWYAAISLVIVILLAVTSYYGLKVPYVILVFLMCVMIMFAPLVFARFNSRAIDITMPASWQAKSLFMIGYTMLVIPFVVMLFPLLSELLASGEGALNMRKLFMDMQTLQNFNIPSWLEIFLNTRLNYYFNGVLPALITLFFVLKFKHNVVLKTLIWDISIGVFTYVCYILITVIYLIRQMSMHFVDKSGPSPEEVEAFTDNTIGQLLSPMILWTVILWMLAMAVMIILVCKKIKNRQI